jgi:hypothetical protein
MNWSVKVDQQTGEFRTSGLLDAPVQFELSGQGPERFSTVVYPSMSTVLDMGTCELLTGKILGPFPNLDGLEPAEDGRPKLKQLLEQIQKQSGNSPNAMKSFERLSESISDVVAKADDWVEANGERSAVALVIWVNVPGTDLSQLRSTLSVKEAIDASNVSNARLPRVLYELVKPGTTVRVELPGHLPFEHQVRGSSDEVEVVEAKFKPLTPRDMGSVRGQVTLSASQQRGAFGVHLMTDAMAHTTPYGYPQVKPPKVSVFANGKVFPKPLLASTTTGKLEFSQLQPGAYTLSIWGARNAWPRQICFAVEPVRRAKLPRLTLYEISPIKIESIHACRGTSERRSLLDAPMEQYTKTFSAELKPGETTIEAKSWGTGHVSALGVSWQGLGTVSTGGLSWRLTPRGGNSLAFVPVVSPGFSLFAPAVGWSIIRLGTGDISTYQSIDFKFGSRQEPGFPKVGKRQFAPFQLARDYTYFIQHYEAGYAIIVKVR